MFFEAVRRAHGASPMNPRLEAVFVGNLRPLPPEGQQTGIFKTAQSAPVRARRGGLAGDAQGDLRVHGGPEKAVHYYPAEHYLRLASHVPALADVLIPGALGENLSAQGLVEAHVCIGDVFAVGAARLQVSQPRRPCWKINHKLGHAGMSRLMADSGCTGWYLRVLAEGDLAAGDELMLVERPAPEMSLARLWNASEAHRPDPAELRALAGAPGLESGWTQRLLERADWLARQG